MDSGTLLNSWQTYQSAWGPVGDDERRELLASSVSDDILYTDPASQVCGVDALTKRIAASQQRFAGSRFHNDSFMGHHGQACSTGPCSTRMVRSS